MHSAWGSALLYEQALDKDPDLIANFSLMGDSSLSVNKYGFRATNEKTTYNDRTQSHFRWDPTKAEYPNFLQFAILDERTRRLWPRQGLADHQVVPAGRRGPVLRGHPGPGLDRDEGWAQGQSVPSDPRRNHKPIPGLHGVGNCVASASGQAYWSGGSTWGPYVTFGFVAARSIARESVKLLGVSTSV